MNQNRFNYRPFQLSQQQMETLTQSLSDLATIVSNISKITQIFMVETRSFIRNLEIRVGQLSKKIPEIPSNTLPSKTEVNPKEECKTLTIETEVEPKEEPATEKLKEIKAQEETGSVTEPEDEEVAQFLAVLRKLQVNISFAEALEKNPPSMACLRSLISDKKTLKGDETVALCDLGSSINLMPLSVMKKLGIQKAQPAKISLEMADKSLKRAYGMVENVLVKVESLYLPEDFVILDTGEDRDDSIILGRTFLATVKALIDVEKGDFILRLLEDHVHQIEEVPLCNT
ncbi:uncharacterized protein LOC107633665 [Arachis ipaensis]|uniref:uncharacterized protein LOC107633665 n=1 Tax=Arachis ipaensis TaxID=130454 RepID=UPI0007AEF22A|nr:uncharacterized protein LOC107633665 [Arachis ipaensis]